MANKYAWRKVFDRRGARVRGLWRRGKLFYAQMQLVDPVTGLKQVKRVPLKATNEAQAGTELAELKKERRQGALFLLDRTPFDQYVDHYLDWLKPRIKPEGYSKKESLLNGWKRHLGATPLAEIQPKDISQHITNRLKTTSARTGKKINPRTTNLELFAVRSVLALAVEEKKLASNPAASVKQEKTVPKVKVLLTKKQLTTLANTAQTMRGGRALADFILLGAYSGGRHRELLALKWQDVDWDRQQLLFRGETTKSKEDRRVDFIPALGTHLKDMASRREPGGEYLFPSARSEKLVHLFHTIKKLSILAKIPFTAHDLRHYFCSMCVMAGVDFLTIARWVGHKDGGVLIGKVYGHLHDQHRKQMAAKVTNV
jgi:integrase